MLAGFHRYFLLVTVWYGVQSWDITAEPCDTSHKAVACEKDNLTIVCPRGHKIFIENALYGRSEPDIDVCPFASEHKKDTDCAAENSTQVVTDLCKDRKHCRVQAINKLFGDPCRFTYKYLDVTYQCVPGDVDECLYPTACSNDGICVNTDGSFTCDCRGTGYEGKTCENELQYCVINNPCENNSTCQETSDGPQCLCSDAYGGERCQYGINDAFWSTWGPCSTTCGRGVSERNCEGPACTVRTQQRPCGSDICFPSQDNGKWTTWSPWSLCTLTCGGGRQLRRRSCQQEDGQAPCVGHAEKERDCNTFDCIDCNYTCPDGHSIHSSCSYCQCDSPTSVTTTVVCPLGCPLQGVAIAMEGLPTGVIQQTDSQGRAVIDNMCASTVLTFDLFGYATLSIAVEDIQDVTVLSRVELLSVAHSPVSTRRLVGETLKLCCSFDGSSPPDSVEWLKNGDITQEDYSKSYESALVLRDLQPGDEAVYKCRANNDAGSVTTEAAIVSVIASEDGFCITSPNSNLYTLPEECEVGTVDVGECSPGSCRVKGATGSDTCPETEDHCCGPTAGFFKDVDCGDMQISVYIVTSCGCTTCETSTIDVIGSVVDGETGDSLPDVTILLKSNVVTTTDENGQFTVTVDVGTTRLTLTAVDMGKTYVSSNQVVRLPSNAEGRYDVTIPMLRAGTPQIINSEDSAPLQLSQPGASNVGTIELPGGAYYLEDGTQYTGEVEVYATVLSPDDPRFENAPGDFTTTDEEGEDVSMMSLGMFALDMRTPDGSQLAVPSFSLTAPPEYADVDGLEVWTMNPNTGKWEKAALSAASRRKKRANILGVEYDFVGSWYNFDFVKTTTCHSKIRLYQDETCNPLQQIQGGKPAVLIVDNNGAKSVSRVRTSNDKTSNGYCLIHRCTKRPGTSQYFDGNFFMEYKGVYTNPASVAVADLSDGFQYAAILRANKAGGFAKIRMDLTEARNRGPLYNWNWAWRYSDACRNAGIDDDHIKFYLPEVLRCPSPCKALPLTTVSLLPTCNTNLYRLWHGTHQHIQRSFTTCFLRVNIDIAQTVFVTASSRSGIDISEAGITAKETTFGTTYDCTEKNFACVEVKAPEPMGCSSSDVHDYDSDFVHVTLTVKDKDKNPMTLVKVKESLTDLGVVEYEADGVIIMRFSKSMMTDKSSGVYCTDGKWKESADSVRDRTEAQCRKDKNQDRWIAQFGGEVDDGPPWSECSVTCGEGIQTRFDPITLQQATRPCNTNVECCCLPWQEWGTCSNTCGGGTEMRNREQNPRATCTCTETVDTRSCGQSDCRQVCTWIILCKMVGSCC